MFSIIAAAAIAFTGLTGSHADDHDHQVIEPQAVEGEWTYVTGWVYADGEYSYYPGTWIYETS